MEQIFTGLSRREQMLLLAACTFAGGGGAELLDALPDEQAERLKPRAAAIQQIPRDKRVAFLVQEVKKLFARRGAADLDRVDPRWLAHALRKERPAMVQVIVRGLPARVAEEVARLQAARLVGKAPPNAVHPDLLGVIRAQLERKLARHAPASDRQMSDLLVVSERALAELVEIVGANEIAPAVDALGPEAPSMFAARLSAAAGAALETACQDVREDRRMTADAGRAWLARYGDIQDVKNLARRAGMKRLARACLAEGGGFLDRLVDRHPGAIGMGLQKWAEALSSTGAADHDLRPEVLSALEAVQFVEASSAGSASGKKPRE